MRYRDYVNLYRYERGMTIEELIEKSGVPKATINNVLYGGTRSPTLETATAIARALGKRLDDFVDEKPAPSGSGQVPEVDFTKWRRKAPAFRHGDISRRF